MKSALETYSGNREPQLPEIEEGAIELVESPRERFERKREARVLSVMRNYADADGSEISVSDLEHEGKAALREYRGRRNGRRRSSDVSSYSLAITEQYLEPGEKKSLLSGIRLHEAAQQERYDLLRGALEDKKPIKRMYVRIRAKAYPALFREFNSTMQKLVKDGRLRTAHELLGARELMLGRGSVDDDIRALEAEAKRTQEPVELNRDELVMPSHEERKELPHTLIQFYANEHIRTALAVLKSETDFSSRAPSTLKMACMRLEESMNAETKEITKSVRRYLLKAISSELPLQRNTGLAYFPDESVYWNNPGGGLTRMFTDKEDVLNFLKAAEGRFRSGYRGMNGGTGGCGGEPWAQIASATYELWNTEDIKDLVPLLDRVFQLEHNNGTVFSKDPSMFTRYMDAQSVLDSKFVAVDLRDLLQRTRVYAGKGGIVERLKNRVDSVDAVLRLAQVYFPAKVSEVRNRLNINSENFLDVINNAENQGVPTS